MKKPMLVSILALVLVVVVISLFVASHLRLAVLRRSLHAAANANEAATVARAIMKMDSPRGMGALQVYASQHEACALDAAHGILLLCDETTGEIHEVYTGRLDTGVATGDPSLDEALTAAVSEMTSQSLSIGSPPRVFKGVHVLSTTKTQADFLLNPRAGTEWFRVRYRFTKGGLTGQSLHDVSDEELRTWRENEDWPPSWK